MHLGPLASLKVLDFSTLLPGPYASLLLADLGAEVLRVESPTRPDLVRALEPRDGGQSAAHSYLNRSKRSLTLDLKRPGAADLVKRLVQRYDIVLEQFRPGVMERLGVGYAALRAANPRVIFCSITGYGQDGPYRDRPGHDINYLALAGVADNCRRRGARPSPLGVQVADVAGGSLHAVIGLLAAVVQRERSGSGQQVDISMTDCAFALQALDNPAWLAGGVAPEVEGGWLNGGTHYDYYPTRDGRLFAVGSLEPQFRDRLCAVLGIGELAGWADSSDAEVRARFKQRVADAFHARDFAELGAAFADAEACVEPVLTLPEASAHPQLRARGMVVEVPRDGSGSQAQPACALKFSAAAPSYRHTGRAPGADNAEVLAELGLDATAVAALQAAGVFG
ncbi:MAG TPA: CaiB/BaiF CoA-transferase family protein [Gammaproteobacteria bacterium]